MNSIKNILFLLICLFLYSGLFSQCKSIAYSTSNNKYYTTKDTLHFSAVNNCKKNKFVVFSLEIRDSTDWQEVDGNIFIESPKGLKIIILLSGKKKRFDFNTNTIDPIFFKSSTPVRFKIVANLYSDDKVQIIQTKTVKEFIIRNK